MREIQSKPRCQKIPFFHPASDSSISEINQRTFTLECTQNANAFSSEPIYAIYSLSKRAQSIEPIFNLGEQFDTPEAILITEYKYSSVNLFALKHLVSHIQKQYAAKSDSAFVDQLLEELDLQPQYLPSESTIAIGNFFRGAFKLDTTSHFGQHSLCIALWGPIAQYAQQISEFAIQWMQMEHVLLKESRFKNSVSLVSR